MGWRYTGLQIGAECGKERGMAFDFKKEYREFYLPKDGGDRGGARHALHGGAGTG